MANKKVVSPIFRVSFPAVFEAKAFDGGEPKFSLAMLWKADAKLDELRKLVEEVAQEFFKGKIPANMKKPFRDGAEKEGVDGYGKGIIFASASSKQAPGIIALDNTRILSPQDFYAGCYARATLTAFGYDQKGNKGVAFGLQNLQKVRDGERLDGRASAENDFAEAQPVSEDNDDFLN